MEEHIALKHVINMKHTIILIGEIIDNINNNTYSFESVENKLIELHNDLLESSYNIEAYIDKYDIDDGKDRIYDKLSDVVALYQKRTSDLVTHTNKAIFPEQIIISPSSELYWLIRKFISSKIALYNLGIVNSCRKYLDSKENEVLTNSDIKYNKTNKPLNKLITPEVEIIFNKAIDKGYMHKNGEHYEWDISPILLAYLVAKLYIRDITDPFPNTEMCKLFDRRGLKQLYNNYHNTRLGKPRQHKLIDELFD